MGLRTGAFFAIAFFAAFFPDAERPVARAALFAGAFFAALRAADGLAALVAMAVLTFFAAGGSTGSSNGVAGTDSISGRLGAGTGSVCTARSRRPPNTRRNRPDNPVRSPPRSRAMTHHRLTVRVTP
jgi:hypothetical protein